MFPLSSGWSSFPTRRHHTYLLLWSLNLPQVHFLFTMVQIKVTVALILAAAAAITPVVAQPRGLSPEPLITENNRQGSRNSNVELTTFQWGTNAATHIYLTPRNIPTVGHMSGPNPGELHIIPPHRVGSVNNFKINVPRVDNRMDWNDIIIHHLGHHSIVNEQGQGDLVHHFTVRSTHTHTDTRFHIHYPTEWEKALTHVHVQGYPGWSKKARISAWLGQKLNTYARIIISILHSRGRLLHGMLMNRVPRRKTKVGFFSSWSNCFFLKKKLSFRARSCLLWW